MFSSHLYDLLFLYNIIYNNISCATILSIQGDEIEGMVVYLPKSERTAQLSLIGFDIIEGVDRLQNHMYIRGNTWCMLGGHMV